MDRSYAFYDYNRGSTVFHIQCEWLHKNIDLINDPNIEYCHVTITDLADYWQRTITRDLLLEAFKPSNALIEAQRNTVLQAAFLGEESVNGSKLEWKVGKESDSDKLSMKLRTFEDGIPLAAGSFLLDKVVPETKKKELHELWFINCAIGSRKSTESNKALKRRNLDIAKSYKEIKEKNQSMINQATRDKITMVQKFCDVLNAKKRKIFSLYAAIKSMEKKVAELEQQLEKGKSTSKRALEDVADPEEDNSHRAKKLKSVAIKVEPEKGDTDEMLSSQSNAKKRDKAKERAMTFSQPLSQPFDDDEHEDDDDDFMVDYTPTVR